VAEGDRKTKLVTAAVILVMGAGIAIYFLVIRPRWDAHAMKTQHGESRGSTISDGVATLIDAVSVTHRRKDTTTDLDIEEETRRRRITLIDTTTGGMLAQQLVDTDAECGAAGNGLIYCELASLALYDRTFAKVADASAELSKLGKIMRTSGAIDKRIIGTHAGPRVTVLLDDGRAAVYDARSREAARVNDTPPTGSLRLRPADVCANGGNRREKIGNSTDTFLGAVRLGGVAPPVFVHHTSLDSASDSLQLSRLAADGKTAWTVDLGTGQCEQFTVDAKRVTITTSNPRARAAGIDLATGHVDWRTTF